MAIAAPRKLDSRTAEEHLALELAARRQEAGLFTGAHRTIVRRLEALLLSPAVEVPVEAFALTAQLRAMDDRYDRRWETES